jgi:hypothetical protein
MTPGRCKLCNHRKDLVESDIWSRFGYKLYAADQDRGGVFADLKELRIQGKRYTEPMFCQECDNEALSQHERKPPNGAVCTIKFLKVAATTAHGCCPS